MTDSNVPANRWNLDEVARVTIDGDEYVIYSDDSHTVAIDAADFGAPTTEHDYSLWCAGTTGAGDHDLVARIAEAAGLDGLYSCGDCSWVNARAAE